MATIYSEPVVKMVQDVNGDYFMQIEVTVMPDIDSIRGTILFDDCCVYSPKNDTK